MSVINETHEGPALWANRGYEFLALAAPERGPSPLIEGASQRKGLGRETARARARARKQEVQRGVPFLRTLTSTREPSGGGAWQGERAPSRIPGRIS